MPSSGILDPAHWIWMLASETKSMVISIHLNFLKQKVV
jgi:hypothetical protein